MSLILLEGLDKSGKSTIAEYFKNNGYEYIHLSAPTKGISSEEYMAEMALLIAGTVNKNVIFDRSFFGELLWPKVYNREPLLDNYRVTALCALCESIHDVKYIYMYDSDIEAHKARLMKFKEPSYDYEYVRNIHERVMRDYDFEFLTFQDAKQLGWV